MGIVALKNDVFTFECPRCRREGRESSRKINISDVVVYSDNGGNIFVKLPLCENCGTGSALFPGIKGDSIKSHMRKCIAMRALENEQFDLSIKSDGKNDKEIISEMKNKALVFKNALNAFYKNKDKEFKDELENKKKIDRDITKDKDKKMNKR